MPKTHNVKTARRPPLDEVQAFVDVATAGSFSAAAERLGIAHSSLSRKVAHLEQWLGVSLLQRTQHGVSLTGPGLEYFMRFRDGLSMIEISDHGHASQAGSIVQVSALRGFGLLWLYPRHLQLIANMPDMKVDYSFERKSTDFSDGTDLSFRYGAGQWPGTRSIRLFPGDARPAAGIDIHNQLGPDATPDEILKYPLVHVGTELAWRLWFEAQGRSFTFRPEDIVVEDHDIAVVVIRSGLCIGLSRPIWRDQVDDTRIFHVSEKTVDIPFSYYLVRPAGRPLRESAQRWALRVLELAKVNESEALSFIN